MPTSRPPKTPTTRPPLEWLDKAPRGMWYELREGKDAPYLARWRSVDGHKESEPFPDAESRAKFAADWLKQRVEFGRAAPFVNHKTLATWREFDHIVGGVDPLAVAREWVKLRGGVIGERVTVKEAVEKYLAFRREGKLSPDTLRHFTKHLEERFAQQFGALPLHQITDELITKWLAGLKHPRTGEPMESVTRRHHRKDLNTFLDYCFRVKKWIPHNPCDGVAVPSVNPKDVSLLTIAEGRRLFAANEGNPVVGRMALEAFGFLRASKAGHHKVSDISFQKRGLRLRGVGTKGEKTRFRQGHPDNLWAWLHRAPDETWSMPWWKYRNEKAIAFRVAGIAESDNRLRRTCISAHLAWLKDLPRTSYLAQHSSTSMTEEYEGIMDENDGAAWFQIGPHFMP